MASQASHRARLCGFVAVVACAVACSSPETRKRQHLDRGNRYAAEHRDQFAVIEYASAVRIDPKFGEARLKLAQTYERLNDLRAAYPEFIRAADALPDDRDAQLKAIQIFLMAHRFEDAKVRATALLAKNARDIDALVLRATAMAGLKDSAGALAEMEQALKASPDDSRTFINLGFVRSEVGNASEAEVAFKRALALAPGSVDAHLAYANFLVSAGRVADAEAELKAALAIEPRNSLANRMLAMLYIATKRPAEAEAPLKTVVDVSHAPEARLQLAQYYLGVQRTQEATDLLTALAAEPATAAVADRMLASIDYDAGRQQEAHARLDKLLARFPTDADALVLKARWLARESRLDDALTKAKAAAVADPQSPAAFMALGAIHDARHDLTDAIDAYKEALRLNPRLIAASVELSRLTLVAGDRAAALRYAEQAKASDPRSGAARVALARTLLAQNDLIRADAEIAELRRGLPESAEVDVLQGALELARQNPVAARQSFDQALTRSPHQVDALRGLLEIDLRAKQFDAAIARIESELTQEPDRAELLAVAGQVYERAAQPAKAEAALRNTVTIDPSFTTGYALLARFYMKEHRLAEARVEFETLVKRDPRAVGPRTFVGVVLEAEGKREEAKRWYQDTVAALPNAAVAANNLAFMYAEAGTDLDTALQLASTAKQQMPDSANVDDTLGWVYYKKNLPTLAIPAFQESLKKRPDSAQVLYHLGLTYVKAGDNAKAREALERSLKINPAFGAAANARQALASLSH
jgi:tetratricopeptide (TPR) repeat protein